MATNSGPSQGPYRLTSGGKGILGSVDRTQLAVGVITGATFLLVFFAIYPYGYLGRPPREILSLNATYFGLDDSYEIGENVKFSIRYEGSLYSDQDYTIKIIQIDNAHGRIVNEMVWFSTEMEEISTGPPERPLGIEYSVHIGHASDPLTLNEAGLYVVFSEGKNVIDNERYFRVNQS